MRRESRYFHLPFIVAAGVLAAVATATAGPNPEPLGSQFQVDSITTSNNQYGRVAIDSSGNFIVTWYSDQSYGTDHSSFSIQGQRFGLDGLPLGSQFQINSLTTSAQGAPDLALDAVGNFVVVWLSAVSGGSDTSLYSIAGQRLDAGGGFVGLQFQVNTFTTGRQLLPSVASQTSGGFVVVWHSAGSSGTDHSGYSIQGQRFASNGAPLGSEFQVNTFTNDNQFLPRVASDSNGNFVVVWQSVGSGGTDSLLVSVQAQRYAANGAPLGSQFQVNTYTTSNQAYPAIASDPAGRFVIVWESNGSAGSDTSGFSIDGQRFAANGTPLGSEFQVNTYTTNTQRRPAVATDSFGNFVVVWDSLGSAGSDASGHSIQAQRFAADGALLGTQFQVNSYTSADQTYPAIASDPAGDFVVAWTSHGSSATSSPYDSIQAQRFAVTIFVDGFGTGDTSRWSLTQP